MTPLPSSLFSSSTPASIPTSSSEPSIPNVQLKNQTLLELCLIALENSSGEESLGSATESSTLSQLSFTYPPSDITPTLSTVNSSTSSITIEDLFSDTTARMYHLVHEYINYHLQYEFSDEHLFPLASQIGTDFGYAPTRYEISALDRYCDIFPVITTNVNVDSCSFNGNFVSLLKDQPFIATQTPYIENQSYADIKEVLFWRSISQNNCCAIFNLTSPSEKCDGYTATESTPEIWRDATIIDRHKSTYPPGEFSTSSLHEVELTRSTTSVSNEYVYVLVNEWRDRQPTTLPCLTELIQNEKCIRREFPKRPVVVHCKAGVGRTGTFMVCCALDKLWDKGLLSADNYQTIILTLVLSARNQRHRLTVQTTSQMDLIVQYARHLIGLVDAETQN